MIFRDNPKNRACIAFRIAIKLTKVKLIILEAEFSQEAENCRCELGEAVYALSQEITCY
jgi:hypothetical protein